MLLRGCEEGHTEYFDEDERGGRRRRGEGDWIMCVASCGFFIFSFIDYMGCRSAHHSMYIYALYALVSTCV